MGSSCSLFATRTQRKQPYRRNHDHRCEKNHNKNQDRRRKKNHDRHKHNDRHKHSNRPKNNDRCNENGGMHLESCNSPTNNQDFRETNNHMERCHCPRHRPLKRGDTVRVSCEYGNNSCHDGKVGIYVGRRIYVGRTEVDAKKWKDNAGFLVATLQTCSPYLGQQILGIGHRAQLVCCPDEIPSNLLCPISLEIMQTPAYARGEPTMQRIELQNLVEWVTQHQNNPLTRKTVTLADVMVDTKLFSILEMWKRRNPKHSGVSLRFKVGDKVFANCIDGVNKAWRKGIIVGLWGNSCCAPYYLIELECGTRVSATADTDFYVKARA